LNSAPMTEGAFQPMASVSRQSIEYGCAGLLE
jgi:hypothetical protein